MLWLWQNYTCAWNGSDTPPTPDPTPHTGRIGNCFNNIFKDLVCPLLATFSREGVANKNYWVYAWVMDTHTGTPEPLPHWFTHAALAAASSIILAIAITVYQHGLPSASAANYIWVPVFAAAVVLAQHWPGHMFIVGVLAVYFYLSTGLPFVGALLPAGAMFLAAHNWVGAQMAEAGLFPGVSARDRVDRD